MAREPELSIKVKVDPQIKPTELKTSPICPHCRYSLEDKAKNVMGQLDSLEIRIDDMVAEWTKMLLDTISDPIVLDQKKFLKAQEAQAIDEFVASGSLPKKVDDFFVKSINALLKGFEPVVIDTDDLIKKLEEMPPMEAIEYIIDIISPIKEKVLMINQGNHEARTYRTEGIDISSLVASQLGISDRYCRENHV